MDYVRRDVNTTDLFRAGSSLSSVPPDPLGPRDGLFRGLRGSSFVDDENRNGRPIGLAWGTTITRLSQILWGRTPENIASGGAARGRTRTLTGYARLVGPGTSQPTRAGGSVFGALEMRAHKINQPQVECTCGFYFRLLQNSLSPASHPMFYPRVPARLVSSARRPIAWRKTGHWLSGTDPEYRWPILARSVMCLDRTRPRQFHSEKHS
jgi:hypothetical protein